MHSHRKQNSFLMNCIRQRELGLRGKSRRNSPEYDFLKGFVEEKASLPNQNQPCEVSGQTRSTLLMEFSPDGKKIASTHGDHSIRVTDIRTGKCTHILTGHPRTPWCIAFHPSNSDILGSGCLGGEVRIWDLQGVGSEVWHSDDALSIASMTFHPLDNVVIFAISNKLHFWDWTRSQPFAICETAHDFEKIRWVKFDCIGHRLLTAIANATEETVNDHSADGRYDTNNGSGEVSQMFEAVDIYPLQRLSSNDDSLMDLRTGWNGHRSNAEHLRNLSSAQRYAHDVTSQHMSSSSESRSTFATESRSSWRNNRESMLQRHAAGSSESGINLSMRSGPFLSSVAPQPSASSSIDWLASSLSQEREPDPGDALLSLVADGRQTPSQYVHNLSGDGVQRRFLAGDDPLSENLMLLEPGYVEIRPLVEGRDNNGSERLINAAASHSRGNSEEHPGSVILNQLLQQEDTATEGGAPMMESTTDLLSLPDQQFCSNNVVASGSDIHLNNDLASTENGTNHVQNNALSDIWLSSSNSWVVHSSPSTILSSQSVRDRSGSNTYSAEASHSDQQQPEPMVVDGRESGLDLRLGIHQEQSSVTNLDNLDSLEHSYAMPVPISRRYGMIASSGRGFSETSEEDSHGNSMEFSFPAISNFMTPSVSHSENASIWLASDDRSEVVDVSRVTREEDDANRNEMSFVTQSSSHTPVLSSVTEPCSHQSNDDSRLRSTRDKRNHAASDSSSARCRTFLSTRPVPWPVHRTGLATSRTAAASSSASLSLTGGATSTATGSMSSTLCSRRTRYQDRINRLNALRSQIWGQNVAQGRASHTVTSNNSSDDSTQPHSCALCNGCQLSHMSNNNDRHSLPSCITRTNAEHLQLPRLPGLEETPFPGFAETTDSSLLASSSLNSHLPVNDVLRNYDSLQQELNEANSMDSEGAYFGSSSRQSESLGNHSSARPRIGHPPDSTFSADGSARPIHVIPRIEIFSDDLESQSHSPSEHVSHIQRRLDSSLRYLDQEPERSSYTSASLSGFHFTSLNERLRERQERINFHVEELRSRFGIGSSSSAASNRRGNSNDNARGVDEDLFSMYHSSSPGIGADAVGESLGNEDRARIVNRLRGFREEIRSMRLEMYRNTLRDQERASRSGYRHYVPIHQFRNRGSWLADNDRARIHAALNRAISGALIASGESSVGNNVIDQTYRIQAWDFINYQIPDLTQSEYNVLVRCAKIHNDANVDISQDGHFLCTFTQPNRNFSGDIMLSVFSLMSDSFGECLYTKSFGPNAISVSISPCSRYVLVGLATKRFTWMFSPKQMVAQVYQLKTPQADEDSMEHVCDITHPCDMDFRAPISMNSAKWLLGPGEGLAYGTNRGDLNICRPGFVRIEKPEVNDSLLEPNPIRRNLMQMLGLTVPRMMSTATQTSLNLRRSASTQTDQNSSSQPSSSLAAAAAAAATMDHAQVQNSGTEDINLF